MLNKYQTTLSNPIEFEGIGLHSGKKSKIRILPAKANDGIIFKRTDLENNNIIKACFKNVTSATLCTTLENNHRVKVYTVEHLLAALYIADIDNALIEIDCEEVPIMDGSAKKFLNKLQKINKIEILNAKRKYLKISKKIELNDGARKISIQPNDSFEVRFELKYENKVIGKQKNTVNFEKDNLKEIVESRTFCLLKDVEKIKKLGLAQGGSLENAIVVDQNKVINEEGLRNKNEFVNHKILDLIGDFSLYGYRIQGKVICHQGGHQLSNMFLKKMSNAKQFSNSTELGNSLHKVNQEKSFSPVKAALNA